MRFIDPTISRFVVLFTIIIIDILVHGRLSPSLSLIPRDIIKRDIKLLFLVTKLIVPKVFGVFIFFTGIDWYIEGFDDRA